MPTGRSGGFLIARQQLETLLLALPSHTVVGKTLKVPVTAGDAIKLLAEHGANQVAIEEQDHAWYVIHLSTWISVNESSAIYSGLRQYHGRHLSYQVCCRRLCTRVTRVVLLGTTHAACNCGRIH